MQQRFGLFYRCGNHARRRRVDLVRTAHQIADLLEPSAPKDFSFDLDKNSAGYVLADPDDVFRILFNLMSNAVSVANAAKSCGPLGPQTATITV